MDAKEIREIQLDIRSQFPDIAWPEPVLEPLFYGRFDKHPVEDRKLVMDTITGAQLDIVSDMYELIPHEVAMHNLLHSLPEEFGKPEHRISIWQNGARFRAELHFPDIQATEIKEGDPVRPRLIQTNSLDRSTFYGTSFGAEELVCTNGLVAYRSRLESKKRHIFGSQELSSIRDNVREAIENFGEQIGIWQHWNELQLEDMTEAQRLVDTLPFSETEKGSLLLLPLMNYDGKNITDLVQDKKATVWTINSAATQYAQHNINSTQRKFELEEKIANKMHQLTKAA